MDITLRLPYLAENTKYLTKLNKIALSFYLEYLNDYLTLERIAEDKDITINYATFLYEEGKSIHERITNND